MTPGEASKGGQVLIVNHPIGGRRVAAHVFDLATGGIVFLDSGWTEPMQSSHPAHAVEGITSEADYFQEQRWQVDMGVEGDTFIEIHPGDIELEGTRAAALAAVRISLGPDLNVVP